MKVSLRLKIADKPEGLRIPIDRLPFLIGRDPVCHLRPASHFISKHHCTIWTRGDLLLVRDLGSTNGTYLNDHAVTGEQQALNGDRLKVGPLLFDVCIEGSPTPMPQMKGPTRSGDVEDAAAMLLLLDEDAAQATTRPVDLNAVPSGATILVPASSLLEKSTASPASSDTATVANALLKRYLRRREPGQ
jgi:pSer/pThr/pTyr-binding forkhead associated (FHA) protein